MSRTGHLLAGVATTTHQVVELALGTGIIGQSQAGFGGALAASTLMDATWIVAARRELYNAILYAWLGAGLVAAVRDTPRRHRPWVLAGAATIVGIRPAVQRHFAWMAREAERNPRWWNRAWANPEHDPRSATA